MEIGISTASFFPYVFTEDSFERIAVLGASVCEVFLATFSEYEKDFIPKLLAKQSIRVHSVHCLTNQFEPETISKNSRVFDDCKMLFEKVCVVGEAMGAKCYTYHGPTLLKRIKYSYDFPFIADRLNILREIAKAHSIDLCYENVHWTYFSSPDYYLALKKYLPDLSTCFDIKQAMQSKVGYSEYLKVMGKSIKTVHLCDYDNDGELKIPGKGVVDFVEFFRVLKDTAGSPACLMEVYNKNYSNEIELKNSFEYLKECEARATISR